ncbi:MAG: hypothetical protein CMP55_04035 [Flavobacteriales bacterium]|nr:hypothetical protein [Flavobacteriales bacterium]
MKYLFFLFLFFLCSLSYSQCVDEESYSITPLGPYEVGDVVSVNYTLETFYQLNINWVIAFQINLGDGWTNLTPTSTPVNSNLNNVGQGSGYWTWDSLNIYPSGLEFGPGFRFINTSGYPDWGSSSTGNLSFSFEVTVAESCTPEDLFISINVFGDCQTGGWNNGDCCSDSALVNYNDSLYIYSDLNSGSDTSVIYCLESNEFNLFDLLGNDADINGYWTPDLNQGYLGQYNPINNTPQEYFYTVFNECDTSTSSVLLNLDNTDVQPTVELQICENELPINLYNSIDANNTTGYWQGPSNLSSDYQGLFNPLENSVGLYNYIILNNNGCQQYYPLNLTFILENIDVGNDYNLEICSDDSAVNLYELIGSPDTNGVWSPNLNSNYLGYFDPTQNLSGLYSYSIIGECNIYQSQVNINVIDFVPSPIITN